MEAIGSIIETGVDRLVKLVKERSEISMNDAAKDLGVGLTVIEEWSEFLEEEGIISIEYRFTKPILRDRNITKKDVTKKEKEFKTNKDIFVRKAEGTLGFLEKEASKLKGVKSEFDKLKKTFGVEIGEIKSEVEELERYHHLKKELNEQVQKQKTRSQQKMHDMVSGILREQKKYEDILSDINKESTELDKEKKSVLSLEESEDLLKKKLSSLKSMIDDIEKKIKDEDLAIGSSKEHINNLKNLTKTMKTSLISEKENFRPLLKESKEQEAKMKKLEKSILEKIRIKEKKMQLAKDSSEKFKKFFDEKIRVINLIDDVNKERDLLQKDLLELIKKAKSFHLTSKSKDLTKDMLALEKKFNEVDEKKVRFEKDFKKLNMLFKKK